jgi:hypothetical protein
MGALVMLIGGLITLLCGTCTLAVMRPAFLDLITGVRHIGSPSATPNASGGDASLAVMALVIGGTPTAVGVIIFVGGLTLFRSARRKPSNGDSLT